MRHGKPAIFDFFCRIIRLAFRASAVVLLIATAGATLPSRPKKGRVADLAGVLSPRGKAELQSLSSELERRTGTELAVVTVGSLEGSDVADYANRLFHSWGVGKKGKDNGVLILLSTGDRKSRIEVGYGLEGVFPDAVAGRILNGEVHAYFRDNKWEEGLLIAARRVVELLSRSAAPRPASAASGPSRVNDGWPPLVVALWLIIPALLFGGCLLGSGLWGPRSRPRKRGQMIFLVLAGSCILGGALWLAYAALEMPSWVVSLLAVLGLLAGAAARSLKGQGIASALSIVLVAGVYLWDHPWLALIAAVLAIAHLMGFKIFTGRASHRRGTWDPPSDLDWPSDS